MNGFNFYHNYYDMIKYLSDEDRLAMYDAIFQYMYDDKEPNFNGLKQGLWVNIKIPLTTSKKNSENGKKGGAPEGNNNAGKQENRDVETSEKQAKNKRNEIQKQTKNKRNQIQKQTNNISYFLFLISNNKYKYIIKDNNIYKSIYKWLSYKEERKEHYKETGLSSLLTQIENQITIHGEEAVTNLIEECMANNYKGIIFDKLKNIKQQKKEIEYARIEDIL